MKNQRGQILLIVVLTMIVALTVGLSIASRIVTELRLSRQNEESQRAFQAAEAGIEQTLKQEQSISSAVNFDENSASFTTEFSAESGSSLLINNGQEVDQAVGADVWLSDYSNDQNLLFLNPMGNGSAVSITLYWKTPNQTSCLSGSGDVTAPALEVAVLAGSVDDPTLSKYVYEASGCARISGAVQGTSGSYTIGSSNQQFRNAATITVTNGLIMKVIPIFNSGLIGITAVSNGNPIAFPAQGSVVESTGTAGNTVRKVTYFRSFPQLPLEVFPYSLISQ